MSGLAVAISWRGNASAVEIVHRMLAAMPHRGANRQVIQPAVGVALGLVDRHETPASACLADARLDNRDGLHQALTAGRSLSDPDLLALGYERWGTALADRLRGDFALAVWDAGPRRLYAARDCFGVRPLYYHASANWLLLASEVEAVLRSGLVDGRLEERVVREYLLEDHRSPRETFFAGVSRVRPGHWLLANERAVREDRYWLPPRQDVRLQPRDCPTEFRKFFRASVSDRLRDEGPVVAQLSGGLDSSSVVCTANAIVGDAKTPKVHTVSAVYPGLDCDETPWVDAVVRRVRFPHHRWDGTGEDNAERCVAHPEVGDCFRVMDGDLRYARQIGARVLLTGVGGDELLFERGAYRDLAAHGRWLALLGETVFTPRFYSVQTGARFLDDAIRANLPAWLRRGLRALWPRPPEVPPSWLAARGPLPGLAETAAPLPELPDATRRCQWAWLTSPNLWWTVELQVLRAARQGIDARFPFLDRRLADFVLAIPYEHRLPHGRMKCLLRRAMARLLPPMVRDRVRVTTFDSLAAVARGREGAWLRVLVNGPEWLAGPYVDQAALRRMFAFLDSGQQNCSNQLSQCRVLMKCAQMELWLRFLRGRGTVPSPRLVTMNAPQSDPNLPCPVPEKDVPGERKPSDGSADYEPPLLIPVGNLRNLLGKSGGRSDYGSQHRP